MSCHENDILWDKVIDTIDVDELTPQEYEDFMKMDLEQALAFAMNWEEEHG